MENDVPFLPNISIVLICDHEQSYLSPGCREVTLGSKKARAGPNLLVCEHQFTWQRMG